MNIPTGETHATVQYFEEFKTWGATSYDEHGDRTDDEVQYSHHKIDAISDAVKMGTKWIAVYDKRNNLLNLHYKKEPDQ